MMGVLKGMYKKNASCTNLCVTIKLALGTLRILNQHVARSVSAPVFPLAIYTLIYWRGIVRAATRRDAPRRTLGVTSLHRVRSYVHALAYLEIFSLGI